MRAASAITLRIAAKKLRRNRMLVLVEMQIALGLLVLRAKHAVGRSELGHDQPASAQVANEASEYRVSNARHGSQDGRRSNPHIADQQGCWDTLAFGDSGERELPRVAKGLARAYLARIVPELTHETYSIQRGNKSSSLRKGNHGGNPL